jgi:hypothetical protein
MKSWYLWFLLCALFILPISARSQTTAYSYEGTWEGMYTAAQGVTRVVVIIQPEDDIHVHGHYLFYADNSNENVPSGHYTITGVTDSATGRLSFDGRAYALNGEDSEEVIVVPGSNFRSSLDATMAGSLTA